MPEKSDVLRARVSSSAKDRFTAVAKDSGLSPSEFLRLMIDRVTEGVEVPREAQREVQQPRATKVTVRLSGDVASNLADDAKAQGVAPSTWAASILTAKFRNAPQPVKPQRSAIRRAFRQLHGMATNTNQMAAAMNRGVLTGDSYAPTRAELHELREGIALLRAELAKFAAGQFAIQKVEGLQDE